jgi:hypothetical protein
MNMVAASLSSKRVAPERMTKGASHRSLPSKINQLILSALMQPLCHQLITKSKIVTFLLKDQDQQFDMLWRLKLLDDAGAFGPGKSWRGQLRSIDKASRNFGASACSTWHCFILLSITVTSSSHQIL